MATDPEHARKLRLVDPETGEIHETECATCQEWARKYHGAMSQLGAMRSDKKKEAQEHPHWPQAIALWTEWKVATGHLKSRWSHERFWLAQPYLEQDGFVVCRWAVYGIALHPNFKDIGLGVVEVYDDWELCFRNRATFERYARRGWANPEARQAFPEAVRFR